MSLKISKELSLPLDFVTQTCSIMAMRRVGKTYTGSVLAEELVAASQPFAVLDPTGAWWGLRSSANGLREGLPVIIIGGEHADVPLEYTAGKVIADLIVDHPGYYVIDLSSTESNAQQDRFATDFAERLYRRKNKERSPLHLFVDEADSFAPQKPQDGQQRMLGAFEALVRRGGIRGIGTTLITQRPAVLNKNVFTQTELLIVLQLNSPQDQDAIDDWVKRNGTKEQRDIMMQSLASLRTGEAWIWSPGWLRIFQQINIRQRRTFNSSATPRAGEKVIVPQKLAKVDLVRLGNEIRETIERASENDPANLKQQVVDLKQKLATAQRLATVTATPKAPTPPPEPKVERIEVPVLSPEQEQVLIRVEQACARFEKNVVEASGLIKQAASLRTEIVNKLIVIQKTMTAVRVSVPLRSLPAPVVPVKHDFSAPIRNESASSSLTKCAATILTVLLSYPGGRTKSQTATLSGYSISSSTFGNGLTELSKADAIIRNGDHLEAKPEAASLLKHFEPLPKGEKLRDLWLNKFGGAPRSLLSYLVQRYPEFATRQEISEATGYSMNSSTFGNALTDLRAPDLIEQDRELRIRASPVLFET